MHQRRKQHQMFPLAACEFLQNVSSPDASQMSCIYFELWSTCSPAEGFRALRDGAGSWGGSLQPDVTKLLPSCWMKERSYSTLGRIQKVVCLFIGEDSEGCLFINCSWRSESQELIVIVMLDGHFTLTSLRCIHVISGIFISRWWFLKTFC